MRNVYFPVFVLFWIYLGSFPSSSISPRVNLVDFDTTGTGWRMHIDHEKPDNAHVRHKLERLNHFFFFGTIFFSIQKTVSCLKNQKTKGSIHLLLGNFLLGGR